MTDIAIFSVESLADGPAGHEIFRRLLIACLAAIGGNTEEVESTFSYAGMPSEWRGAIWSAISEIENLQRRGSGNRDHARTLLEACYSNLQAFKVGLQWQQIVEATTLRTLRGLKAELISEIVTAYQKDTDKTNAHRFQIQLASGKASKTTFSFEKVVNALFDPHARYMSEIAALDMGGELRLDSKMIRRVK